MLELEQIRDFVFPKGYVPFDEINLCSNSLIDVKLIFTAGDVVPLIIGKGDVPLIWLKAFDGRRWISVLERNKPMHKLSSSMIINNTIIVNAGSTNVIKANIIDGVCNVSALDLRPLGLNVYGDKKNLIVGMGEFANNKFKGVGVMIGFPNFE